MCVGGRRLSALHVMQFLFFGVDDPSYISAHPVCVWLCTTLIQDARTCWSRLLFIDDAQAFQLYKQHSYLNVILLWCCPFCD